jgi:hypothetical protein
MRTIASIVISFALVIASAREAHALGPVGVEVGGIAGYGSNPIHPSNAGNPFGVGVGGRAGLTFFGLYAGARAIYYFGKDPSGDDIQKRHSLFYGGEFGSNIRLGPLAIRPQLGAGLADLAGNPEGSHPFTSTGLASSGDFDQTTTTHRRYIYIEPGIAAIITLGTYFIGADANLLIIPSVTDNDPSIAQSTYLAVTLHGQAGFSF